MTRGDRFPFARPRERLAGVTVNVLPVPGVLVTRHAAAVRLDDALDDAQAEAVAVNLLRERVGAAVERLEDPGQLRRGDAEPAILDLDDDLAIAP